VIRPLYRFAPGFWALGRDSQGNPRTPIPGQVVEIVDYSGPQAARVRVVATGVERRALVDHLREVWPAQEARS
jgi:hypothetical protein